MTTPPGQGTEIPGAQTEKTVAADGNHLSPLLGIDGHGPDRPAGRHSDQGVRRLMKKDHQQLERVDKGVMPQQNNQPQ